MTIDINELREAIQTFGSQAINEDDLNELLDRLEAAEKERDTLQAKIKSMEQQEPIRYERRIKRCNEHTWGHWGECYKTDYTKAKTTGGHYPRYSDDFFDYEMRPIYALPGAKGE